MDVALVVSQPPELCGRRFPVGDRPLMIGRAPNCHVRCDAAQVSRLHCAVVVRGRNAYVRDLASSGGTYLNGRRIDREHELVHGDRLRVGPVEFEVHLRSGEPAPTAARAPWEVSDDEAAALLLAADDEPAGPDDVTKLGVDAAAVPEPPDDGDGTGQFCDRCGKEGEWVPPTRMVGRRAASVFRCPEGHSWQVFAE